VIEGPTLVADAIGAGLDIEAVYADEELEVIGIDAVVPVAAGVLGRVLDSVTPQGVCAVGAISTAPVEELASAALAARRPLVVLDRIADPGNAGTILRSAEAAGCVGVVVTDGSVDPWSPKTVRASGGALFRLPIALVPGLADVVGLDRLGTAADAEVSHLDADLDGALAVVVGNEAHGLDPTAPVDRWIRVEMDGPTESLNVAMAATVVLFEAMRQRHAGLE
jgi:TrmH family RNA methyltransferase